jgi:hypothetical protein
LQRSLEHVDTPQMKLRERAEKIRKRIGRWMLDIDEVAGGAGKWEQLRIKPQMQAGHGPDRNALPSLKGVIKKDDLRGQYSYSLWSVTAADIARHDHPSPEADQFFDRVYAQAKKEADKPHERAWLVNKDREWLP